MSGAEAKHGLRAEGSGLPAEDSGDMLALSDISLMQTGPGLLIPGLRLCFVAYCEHWIFLKEEWSKRNMGLPEFPFSARAEHSPLRGTVIVTIFFYDYRLMLLFTLESGQVPPEVQIKCFKK